MTPDEFPCELVTWQESYEMARALAMMVKEDCFGADIVIAIGRGGYVPARVVCDFLLQDMLTSFKMEHWGSAAKEKPEVRVRFPLAVEIRDQKVLVVDDVTDTGGTLQHAIEYLRVFPPGRSGRRCSSTSRAHGSARIILPAKRRNGDGSSIPGRSTRTWWGSAREYWNARSSPPARCGTPCSGITAFRSPWLRCMMRSMTCSGVPRSGNPGNATGKVLSIRPDRRIRFPKPCEPGHVPWWWGQV